MPSTPMPQRADSLVMTLVCLFLRRGIMALSSGALRRGCMLDCQGRGQRSPTRRDVKHDHAKIGVIRSPGAPRRRPRDLRGGLPVRA